MASNMTGLVVGSPVNSEERHTTAQFPLGARCFSDGGEKEWCYIQAGAAIAQYEAVKLALSATNPYGEVVKTAAITDHLFGVASAAFADNEFGFVQTRGVCTCKFASGGETAGLPVDPSATAGAVYSVVAGNPHGGGNAVALVAGVAAGSAIYLGQ